MTKVGRSMLAILFIAAASPATAQNASSSVDGARQIADTVANKYEAAFNAGDAQGVANLYTEDATYFPALGGVLTGRQAIEAGADARFKQSRPKLSETVSEAQFTGDSIWAAGDYTLTISESKSISGHYAYVIVRTGEAWRIRMAISNLTPPK
jgi:uncharacterized protein (TIGR02246 family)